MIIYLPIFLEADVIQKCRCCRTPYTESLAIVIIRLDLPVVLEEAIIEAIQSNEVEVSRCVSEENNSRETPQVQPEGEPVAVRSHFLHAELTLNERAVERSDLPLPAAVDCARPVRHRLQRQ